MGVTNAAGRPATQKPATNAAPPARAAAPAQQQRQAPPAQQQRAAQGGPGRRAQGSFGDATPRGSRANLDAIDDVTSAVYTVEINKVERKMAYESKHPQPAESTVIELKVVESNNPKCPPGFVASVVFTDRYFQDLYFGEVKGFLCGLLNATPDKVDETDWNMVAGRIDLLTPEGMPEDEWVASEEFQQRAAWREEHVLGKQVSVTVRRKLRKDKHPLPEYAWASLADDPALAD